MPPTLELGYVGVRVPDPAALTDFFGDVIGLMPGAATADGGTTWRNDDRVHRIIVEPGSENDAAFVGFEVDDDGFEHSIARLLDAGHEVEHGTPGECDRRRVRRLARTTAPWGVTIELVTGLEPDDTPFESALVPGGFLTDGVGFGHVVFATTEFDAAIAFATEALGLQQTDWLAMPLGDGIELEVRFFHANPRHHTLALARAPFEMPQRLHHIMVETRDRDDVGRAFDRAWDAGLSIPNGLGRHDNDGMFSFYVQSPAGFQIEVGHGGVLVEEPWTDDRQYDRISAWGHQPLR